MRINRVFAVHEARAAGCDFVDRRVSCVDGSAPQTLMAIGFATVLPTHKALQMHSFLYAIRPLLLDFLATLVFIILVALKVDPTIAAASAIAIGVGQVVFMKLTGRPVAALQWMGLGLVLVFGGASLLTHDTRFLMVKPTVVYLLIGGVMLQRGWMLRYLPPVAAGHGEDVMIAFGYIWAGLMLTTAVANAVVAIAFTSHWVAFMAVVPMASKFGLFAIQYLVTRTIVRRRVIASRPAPSALAA
jgi:intracellular septation protein